MESPRKGVGGGGDSTSPLSLPYVPWQSISSQFLCAAGCCLKKTPIIAKSSETNYWFLTSLPQVQTHQNGLFACALKVYAVNP